MGVVSRGAYSKLNEHDTTRHHTINCGAFLDPRKEKKKNSCGAGATGIIIHAS